MPRPLLLKDLFEEFHQGKITDEGRQRLLDATVPYAIALQDGAGIDIVSDGEWRRFSYVAVIADIASGFSRGYSGAGRDGKYWHTVTDELKPRHTGLLAEDARFTMQHTHKRVKVALPSPYLLAVRTWDEKLSRRAYPTREAFAHAVVPILRAELVALRDAGVHTVQIDDPHLCLFVDPDVRSSFEDPDAEAMRCVELINGVVHGIEGVRTAVHLCRRNKGRKGWIGEGAYDRIMEPLSRLEVDELMMEFTIPAAGDVKCLNELPSRFHVGLGCVDCRGSEVDTPEVIMARVERALSHVPKERLLLVPDCGFAPGNAADIPIDEAYAKLRNMVLAAERLRQKYG